MYITKNNCGDILCLYQTGTRIRILDVDPSAIFYETESGQRFFTTNNTLDAFIESDFVRCQQFNRNCMLGHALDAAKTRALKTLLNGVSFLDDEKDIAERVLYTVGEQKDYMLERMAKEAAEQTPGKELASLFLSQLYELGTGSHDTFFGHRVENISQSTGTFSVDGRFFDYSEAMEYLSHIHSLIPAKSLDSQISGASERKNRENKILQFPTRAPLER